MKHVMAWLVAGVVVLVGCAPASPPVKQSDPQRPPVPTSTTTTTTTRPVVPPGDHDPGYVLMAWAPRSSYVIRFDSAVPQRLRNEVTTAAAAAASHSGVALTVQGTAPSTTTAPSAGEIRVFAKPGCGSDPRAVGCAYIWATSTPGAIHGTDVWVSPDVFDNPALLRDVTLHELGHALGLDHVSIDVTRHAPLVMGNPNGVPLGSYQRGDRVGLAASAARTPAVSPSSMTELTAHTVAHSTSTCVPAGQAPAPSAPLSLLPAVPSPSPAPTSAPHRSSCGCGCAAPRRGAELRTRR